MSAIGERGFTLLEMLVTVAVLGLIMGIGYPALGRAINHMAFVRAAADTGASLRRARAMAIKADTSVSLTLGADGRWLAGGRPLSDRLPQGVAATMEPANITFFADGTAQPTEVRLSDGHEQWHARIAASGVIS